MGCIPSKERGTMRDEEHLHLFLARARNRGVYNEQLIAITENNQRKKQIKQCGFVAGDVEVVAKQWNDIPDEEYSYDLDLRDNVALPQEDEEKLRKEREQEIKTRHDDYDYIPGAEDTKVNLPRNPKKLPRAEFKGADHAVDLIGYAIGSQLSLKFHDAAHSIQDKFVDEKDAFKNWRDLYKNFRLPAVAKDDRWRTDKEFAQQRQVADLHDTFEIR